MSKIRSFAVLTSGGDAPGMNAAVRTAVRLGIQRGLKAYGVYGGYRGLMDNNIHQLTARDVGNIIHVGGTVLGSARAPEFITEKGQKQALRNLAQKGVDAVIVVGGNGSQQGTNALHKLGFPAVGVASTIDNDLYGSDITIGVDTALNVALEAIDRLRVTAGSHNRAFMLEVMGRDCGYLGLMAGLAGGAEWVQIPESEYPPERVAQSLMKAYERGKKYSIVVVAEGCDNDADELYHYFKDHKESIGFPVRLTRLGHVQRGGTPTASDRILASRLAAKAVECVLDGTHGVLVGTIAGHLTTTPLETVVSNKKELDLSLLELAHELSR
ncbi:MAG: ATP-dependent 6-phosphofructokinase [Chloroflexota bacterium]